jgi:hypothetical protein
MWTGKTISLSLRQNTNLGHDISFLYVYQQKKVQEYQLYGELWAIKALVHHLTLIMIPISTIDSHTA